MQLQEGDIIEIKARFEHYPHQGEHEIIRVTPTTAVAGMFTFCREFELSDCGRYGRIKIKGGNKSYSASFYFKTKEKKFVLAQEYQD